MVGYITSAYPLVGVDQEHELLSFQVEIACEYATVEAASRHPQPLVNVTTLEGIRGRMTRGPPVFNVCTRSAFW